MTRLKQETRSLHRALENNPAALKILANDVSMAAYRAYLEKFYGFYAPVEAAIERLAREQGLPFAFAPRRKTELLTADLRSLGLSRPAIEQLPRCPNVPALPTPAHGLGCCYVLEGATLGGQIILRHLRQRLGITPACGGQFFNSYGSEVGPMWQAFGEAVTGYAATATPAQIEAMIDTACRTFASLDRWLTDQ